ncbi:YceI family protein [Pseudocnuella soli]|uniref:YceI family protein n=1 Tax=Pseudocnuella soli TaxID=2502779 RepID=UPI001045275E|nr:YceI family protein [Pseudocnuella soli]
MKLRLFVLFMVLCLCSGFQHGKPALTRWVITSGCSLKVDGSTNVNNFSCVIANYSRPDTIMVVKGGKPFVQLNGHIKLDVQQFDCHNPVMTADLRKTLKSKEHPYLVIRFVSINKYPENGTRQAFTKGMVHIELAGVSKQFEVAYKVVAADRGVLNLIGSQQVNFSDFNIAPPRKLGGMIKTNNELNVVFDLKIKVIE